MLGHKVDIYLTFKKLTSGCTILQSQNSGGFTSLPTFCVVSLSILPSLASVS